MLPYRAKFECSMFNPQCLSHKYIPTRMSTVPNKNQGVICSWSSHQAKRMVVIGLKYTQLVATTAPS